MKRRLRSARRMRNPVHVLAAVLRGSFTYVAAPAEEASLLIDDFSRPDGVSALGTTWRAISDRVMGGRSEVSVAWEAEACLRGSRLSGQVSLANRGGFVQMALDLAEDGKTLDATGNAGVRLRVRGNGERYSIHLRTPDNTRPWQSCRAQFVAEPRWSTVSIPFAAFEPYRVDTGLDVVSRLRGVGIVAIGREFTADLMLAEIGLFR